MYKLKNPITRCKFLCKTEPIWKTTKNSQKKKRRRESVKETHTNFTHSLQRWSHFPQQLQSQIKAAQHGTCSCCCCCSSYLETLAQYGETKTHHPSTSTSSCLWAPIQTLLLPSSMAVSSWCCRRRKRRLSTCALQQQQHKTSLRLYCSPDSSLLDPPLLQNQKQISLPLSLSLSLSERTSQMLTNFSLHPTSECKKKIGVW